MGLIVGITGGIGSGKSIVSKIFHALGVPVYNSDLRSKAIVNSNVRLRKELIHSFGEHIYTENGLDKPYFARIIFNDKQALELSNRIIHPYVKNDFETWVKTCEFPYVLKESAILFETGIYKQLDKTILVTAPEKIRIKRIMKRDNMRWEQVMSRISNQLIDDEKLALADFVIDNSGVKPVIPQVVKIHETLLAKASIR